MGHGRVTPEVTIADPYGRGAAGIMCRETTLGDVKPGDIFSLEHVDDVLQGWSSGAITALVRGRGEALAWSEDTPVVVICVVQRARPVPRKGGKNGR